MTLHDPANAPLTLVTGAGSGIGRALALAAARRGFQLALLDRDEAGLTQTATLARALGVTTNLAVADVRDRAGLARACQTLGADNGELALVFVNAGVLRGGPLWEMTADDVDLVLDINIKGAINTLWAVLPRLLAQTRRSRIVATASVGALTAAPGLGVYSASKHALWALCECLQRDLRAAAAPVDVSLLCPGAVSTALADHEGDLAQSMRQSMEQKGLSPDDLAERAFAELELDRFWLFPQPDYLVPIRRRLQRVIDQQDPVART